MSEYMIQLSEKLIYKYKITIKIDNNNIHIDTSCLNRGES